MSLSKLLRYAAANPNCPTVGPNLLSEAAQLIELLDTRVGQQDRQINQMRKALTWMIRNSGAHPANVRAVAQEALDA
jgi:hypothetical protein